MGCARRVCFQRAPAPTGASQASGPAPGPRRGPLCPARRAPQINPNYFTSRISGNLSVSFYDAPAGWKARGPGLGGASRVKLRPS
jgi:hypothetical protein